MASEYWNRKFRDVHPEEKRPLTPKERRANWWHYHKWHVLAGVVLLALAADLGWSILRSRQNLPDYQIAYVGDYSLPEDTTAALEAALAAFGEDVNGDGQVIVRLVSYPLLEESGSEEDAMYAAASSTRLMADLEVGESAFFLLEDPEGFQEGHQILRRLDGSLPEAGESDGWDCVLRWGDCPVLAGLALGEYAYSVAGETVSGESQALLEDLYLARRGYWRGTEEIPAAAYDAFWDALTEGAVS